MGPWLPLQILVLGSLSLLATAASPEEISLSNAILSAGPATLILTKDITLTADLPQLPDNKVLIVRGRCGKSGKSQCTINGGNTYRHFWKAERGPGSLVLDNLVITATKADKAAVDIGGDDSFVSVRKVKFVNNACALSLWTTVGNVTDSQFLGHTKSAIVHASERLTRDVYNLKIVNCVFTGNRAEPGYSGGGAILAKESATLNVDKCTFKQNSATERGGAITISGASQYNSYGRVTNSKFISNACVFGGAAIFVRNGLLSAVSNTFQGNLGGAVLIAAGSGEGSKGSFTKCSFVDNKSPNIDGGAFLINTNTDIEFCRCKFSGNTGVNGVASNGYALDEGNQIFTNPFVTIPFVTTGPESFFDYLQGGCS